MPDQVDEAVKKERCAALLKLDAEASLTYRKAWLGEKREVLLEETVVLDGSEYLVGHTREYVKAAIPCGEDAPSPGEIISARMERMLTDEVVLLAR